MLLNNLFADNRAGQINLPAPGPNAQGNQADHNLFSSNSEYLINPWGGNSTPQLLAFVADKIDRRPELWSDGAPRLNLDEWQQVSGWGLLSAEDDKLTATLGDDYTLSLDVSDALLQVKSLPVAGLSVDYLGEPIPAQAATIGPFQRLHVGHNTWRLWPIASSPGER